MIPDGWTATRRPLSALIDPRPLLTAASFDLDSVHREGSCFPDGAVDLKPPGGAVVSVVTYGRLGRASELPRRPESFALGPRRYGGYECAGESYDLQFREHGRGYRVNVWLERDVADPEVLADARSFLDSLELGLTE